MAVPATKPVAASVLRPAAWSPCSTCRCVPGALVVTLSPLRAFGVGGDYFYVEWRDAARAHRVRAWCQAVRNHLGARFNAVTSRYPVSETYSAAITSERISTVALRETVDVAILVAAMVTLPAATALTMPVSLTVATAASLLDQAAQPSIAPYTSVRSAIN